MAEVALTIGGYHYQLACRDGEEDHLRRLAGLVDAKSAEARAAVGNAGEARQLLISALLLADESIDKATLSQDATPQASPPAEMLERLAAQLESLAERVEKLNAAP